MSKRTLREIALDLLPRVSCLCGTVRRVQTNHLPSCLYFELQQAALATPTAADEPSECPHGVSHDSPCDWCDFDRATPAAAVEPTKRLQDLCKYWQAKYEEAIATPAAAAEPAISGTKRAMMASKRRFYIGTAQRGPYLAGIEDAILALRTGDKP